jgi:N-acetyl-anhydromuramyl-L-alanine amidase AmpD
MSNPPLQKGIRSPEVGNWQRFLNEEGCTDWQGKKLVEDEDFGERSMFATKVWQQRHGLPPTGIVNPATRMIAISSGFIGFMQAKHYVAVLPSKPRTIELVVLHTMEYPERPTGAEWCGGFFTNPQGRRPDGTIYNVVASAHYAVDQDSVMQCVRERDVAHAAPGANHNGIHIEHVGYASQTAAQWQDESSRAVLRQSARLVRKLCLKYNLPMVRLSVEDVLAKKKGLCGHDTITKAFPVIAGKKMTHWDPGPNFPWATYLNLVRDNP